MSPSLISPLYVACIMLIFDESLKTVLVKKRVELSFVRYGLVSSSKVLTSLLSGRGSPQDLSFFSEIYRSNDGLDALEFFRLSGLFDEKMMYFPSLVMNGEISSDFVLILSTGAGCVHVPFLYSVIYISYCFVSLGFRVKTKVLPSAVIEQLVSSLSVFTVFSRFSYMSESAMVKCSAVIITTGSIIICNINFFIQQCSGNYYQKIPESIVKNA